MKIEIDDEFMSGIDEFRKELRNPVIDEESAIRFEKLRQKVLGTLLGKVEAQEAMARITA